MAFSTLKYFYIYSVCLLLAFYQLRGTDFMAINIKFCTKDPLKLTDVTSMLKY